MIGRWQMKALLYAHADYGDIQFANALPVPIQVNGQDIPNSVIDEVHTASLVTNDVTLRINFYLS